MSRMVGDTHQKENTYIRFKDSDSCIEMKWFRKYYVKFRNKPFPHVHCTSHFLAST